MFLGVDASGRPAAVKRLHPELLAEETARARFRREVELARRVASRCAAAVLDADLDGATPFVAFEYVAGVTLGQHVRDSGPLPAEQLRLLALGLAEALRAIHDAGVLHRDLSSGNVLLTDSGPRVVDFGIARAAEAAATAVTVTGLTVGTPGWMPPEQVRGEPPSEAGDVFSWACLVAYAAGRAPFGEGRPEAVLYRTVHEPPQLPDLPPPLDDLVPACLDKDPSRRPSTGDLVATLLSAPVADPKSVELAISAGWSLQPTTALPAGSMAPAATVARRRGGWLRAVAGAAGLLVVAVVGLGAAGVFGTRPAGDTAAVMDASTDPPAEPHRDDGTADSEPLDPDEPAPGPGEARPEEALVPVPEVVGLARTDAVDRIRQAGLRAVWARVIDTDAAHDTVVRAEPDDAIASGGLVRVYVAHAPASARADPDDPAFYFAGDGGMPALAPECSGVLSLCLGNPVERALERLGTDDYRHGDGRGGVYRFWELGPVTLSATSDEVGSITDLSVGVRDGARASTPVEGVVAGQSTLGELLDAYRDMGATVYPDVLSGEGITIVNLWTWLGPEGSEVWSGSVSVGWGEPLADRLFDTPADDVEALLGVVGHLSVTSFSVGYDPPGGDWTASGVGATDGFGQPPAWVVDQLAEVGDGWDLADGSAWDPGATLNAVTGRFKGAATGRGMQVFFFVRDRGYIGRDTSQASNIVQIAWRDDTTIAVEYTLYRDGDAGCCPTGGSATVRYHWNGERLIPLDPIPPLEGPLRR